MRREVADRSGRVLEVPGAIEHVEHRIASILGPAIARGQSHVVGPVFVEHAGVQALRLADDHRLRRIDLGAPEQKQQTRYDAMNQFVFILG